MVVPVVVAVVSPVAPEAGVPAASRPAARAATEARAVAALRRVVLRKGLNSGGRGRVLSIEGSSDGSAGQHEAPVRPRGELCERRNG
nr:hypothetical protein StreXyl84_39260 [Streptomyces sp. Xyl84]